MELEGEWGRRLERNTNSRLLTTMEDAPRGGLFFGPHISGLFAWGTPLIASIQIALQV